MGENGSGANAIERLERELAEIAGAPVLLERPGNPEHGDYATSVALKAAPTQKKVPRELAEDVAGRAGLIAGVESASVAGPGFVNLVMAPAWYGEVVAEILRDGDGYGAGTPARQSCWSVREIPSTETTQPASH
jgi:arginyl-tRNA synthetase